MLTNAQRYKYFQLAQDAYQVESARLAEELPAFSEWRHQINVSTTGCFSIKEMDHVEDFDKVMLELAIIAMDEFWINRLTQAAGRRLHYVIDKQFLPDLEFLEQQPVAWDYVVGIMDHMHLPRAASDCPPELLLKVLQALDTHIRRLARKAGIALADLPSGYFRRGVRADKAKALYHHHKKLIKQGAAA